MRTWIVTGCLLAAAVCRPAAAQPNAAGRGQAALAASAQAQKYLFLFFWKEDNAATSTMRQTLEKFISSQGQRASWVAVQTGDPAEKSLVDQFGVSRAPLPLVLAVAPNGAITGGFPLKVTESQLAQALVSAGMTRCLKALQSRKLVLLCVQSANQTVPAGVQAFLADPQYHPHTELVSINAADPGEAATLRQFQVASQPGTAVTLLLAPPGQVLGKFEGDVGKEQVLDKLKSAKGGC
jgi:hypothetical protein